MLERRFMLNPIILVFLPLWTSSNEPSLWMHPQFTRLPSQGHYQAPGPSPWLHSGGGLGLLNHLEFTEVPNASFQAKNPSYPGAHF